MTYKYSARVSFNPGDTVKVSGGPYHVSAKGTITRMGVKGTFIFHHEDTNRKGIWVQKTERDAPIFVYMGPEVFSPDTRIHSLAHKLKKKRKQKVAS